jgi:hypothetical protein
VVFWWLPKWWPPLLVSFLASAMFLDIGSILSLNIKTRRSPAGSLKK